MREHRDYSKNDNAPLTDGDTGFVGVDMRTAPHLLPAGFVADARNARFRFGVAEPRMGVMPIAYGETYFEFPIEWNNGDIDWSRQFRADFGDVFGLVLVGSHVSSALIAHLVHSVKPTELPDAIIYKTH